MHPRNCLLEDPKEVKTTSILDTYVLNDYEYHLRKKWLERAVKLDKKGNYGIGDAYLLKWFLGGHCDVFKAKPRATEGDLMFKEVWDALLDDRKLNEIDRHPIQRYICRLLDEKNQSTLETDPEALALTRPTTIRHTTSQIVT